jgi:hypothetical protein
MRNGLFGVPADLAQASPIAAGKSPRAIHFFKFTWMSISSWNSRLTAEGLSVRIRRRL